MSAQSRRWVYTQFQTEIDEDGECYVEFQDDAITYHVYQLEISPSTEREHRQGYIEFSSPKRLSWLKNNLCEQTHWEKAQGSRNQCRDYCTKEETRKAGSIPVEYGDFERGGQGTRNDIKTMHQMVKSGKHTLEEIADEATTCYYRYKRTIVEDLRWPLKIWETKLIIYYGPAGGGKSTHARGLYPDAYYKQPNNNWWCGYNGQSAVIVDEFTGAIPPTTFQRICDPGRPRVNTKGSSTQFMADTIVIISNFHPSQWWDENTYLGPIQRRCTELRYFPALRAFEDITWPQQVDHEFDEPSEESKS